VERSQPSTGRAWRLPWPPRTVFVVIPLHLVAFLLLYLGVVQLALNQVTVAHEQDIKVMIRTVVEELHPAMVCGDAEKVRERLAQYVAAHRLLALELYDRRGRPLGPTARQDPEVRAFLMAPEHESYRVIRAAGSSVQLALMRITAEERCAPCHTPGEPLGVASVARDLRHELAETKRRLRVHAGLLTGGWILLVGLLNLVLSRAARRTVRSLAAGGEDARPSLAMDPVALELYRSLRATLRARREERRRMDDHLQRTDRLATVGTIAAGIAHEIKNPLAGVQGALELLVEECQDHDRRDLFERMLEEIRRVQRTVQSLLAFARPRPVQPRVADLGALLADVAALLEPACRRQGIELRTRVAAGTGSFVLDPEQIRQVLVNLVTNAMEATGRGGTVELSAAPLPEGDGVVLAVQDDGPGVAPEVAGRLFEPFVTTKLHGTGLGLAVAQRIVEEHGGEIQVESTPGRTIFHIVLPARRGGETDAADPDRRG